MKVVFFGSPSFAVPSLLALLDAPDFEVTLVVSRPDKKSGRGQIVTAPPISRIASERGLPLLAPEGIGTNLEFLDRIRAQRPDFLVVVAYGKILPAQLLAVARHAAVNLHASLLPKFRGASPVQAAILAGDRITGVCTIQMTAGLDEGPVYLRREIEILDSDDAESLSIRLAGEGASILLETLRGISAGALVAKPQEGEPTYCGILRKNQGEVDWSRPAQEILRARRAFTPWPGLFTFLRGERVKLLDLEPGSPEAIPPSPGAMIRRLDGGFDIACGNATSVRPRTLQREGRRPVSEAEFLRGVAPGGARFGR